MPLNGAPMSLVTLADLTAPAHSDMSHKVYELVAMRIQDRARPMPPDPTKRVSDASIEVYVLLQSWAAGGAQPGAACVAAVAGTSGAQAGVAAPVTNVAGSGSVIVGAGVAGTGVAAGSGSAGEVA